MPRKALHVSIAEMTVPAAAIGDLLAAGTVIEGRGGRVRELRNRLTTIARPRERCLFVPHRGNNVIATMAEALWVIAGRNDIGWLSHYLPRAIDFSDDGVTWRGGYGPRLRTWNGVDQIRETRRLLMEDMVTRRASISLYDPDRDFVQSLDIPCNNWLHWLVRDGMLHLTAGVRSNDVIWGFSGVNSFTWSVLQEMMAFWIGVEVGDATYLAASFHLYAHHDERAHKMIAAFKGVTCYDFGLTPPLFGTAFDQFDEVLADWFSLEAETRSFPERSIDVKGRLGDPFLAVCLEIVRLYHGEKLGWATERLSDELSRLPSCDLVAAVYELFSRRHPNLTKSISDHRISRFLEAYSGVSTPQP